MKNIFLGANWKMNPPPAKALDSDSIFRSTKNVEVVVFPTFIDLASSIQAKLSVGAQYARAEEKGAFTGDVSMVQVKKLGCTHVLCGHSERRQFHGETDAIVSAEVASALATGLTPLFCIGETSEERNAGKTKEVLRRQLSLCADTLQEHCIIAYEPVWAIGTGKTPTPEEAEEMHSYIRSLLPSTKIRILYGGSMNGSNAAAFLAEPNIDGGLIGGASIKPDDFQKIIEAACM